MSDPAGAGSASNSNTLYASHTSSTLTRETPAPVASTTPPVSPRMTTPSRADSYPIASLPGLPPEKLNEILEYLPVSDLLRLGMTSRHMDEETVSFLRFKPVDGRNADRADEYAAFASRVLLKACAKLKTQRSNARLEIAPWQANAKAKMAARLAELSGKAAALAAGLGRRFGDISINLDDATSCELAQSLIPSPGWTHLELNVVQLRALVPILWQLVEIHAHADAPARKFSIVCTDNEFGPASLASRPDRLLQLLEKTLTCLPERLQLSTLRLPGCAFDDFSAIIAENPLLEALEIEMPNKEDATIELTTLLAACQNLKSLGLYYRTALPQRRAVFTRLLDTLKDLPLPVFSLSITTNWQNWMSARLATLVTPHRRELAFENFFFMTGSVAGLGDAICQSRSMEFLAFSNCTFSAVAEFDALLDGVAGSTSLLKLSVVECSRRGAPLDARLLAAAGQCISLQQLEICPTYAKRHPKALANLRLARPDLEIHDGPSDGSVDSSDEDDIAVDEDAPEDHSELIAECDEHEVWGREAIREAEREGDADTDTDTDGDTDGDSED
ncbi:MAG: hypothetical protein JWP36_2280 [Paucimonas sp.]|nr:hypothetical protein [Paucimonas sp.]